MNAYEEIKAERDYQDRKWGHEFDDRNTINDWVAYVATYLGRATLAVVTDDFRREMVKVASLAVAAIETVDRTGSLPPRHYDQQEGETR